MIEKMKKISLRYLLDLFIFILLMPFGIAARVLLPETWLVSERPEQARDNGFHFFSYMRTKHPEQRVYYVIDKRSNDHLKISGFGNVIQYRSLCHYFMYIAAKKHISSQIGGGMPNPAVCKRLKKIIAIKNIFLQHGIIYNKTPFCFKQHSQADLFICGGLPEYEFVKDEFGYPENEVVYTGLCRFDGLHDIIIDKTKILLLPTWRIWIARDEKVDFVKTEYFKRLNALINDKRLTNFLEANNMKLIFFPHNEMRKFMKFFSSKSSAIVIVSDDSAYDFQKLLKETALLITDSSSVHFDFAYMKKPVIYYHFDFEEFCEKQQARGYFDFEKHGFGPVVHKKEELFDRLIEGYARQFDMSDLYRKRIYEFFTLHDTHNCERVYEKIKNIDGRKNNVGRSL